MCDFFFLCKSNKGVLHIDTHRRLFNPFNIAKCLFQLRVGLTHMITEPKAIFEIFMYFSNNMIPIKVLVWFWDKHMLNQVIVS